MGSRIVGVDGLPLSPNLNAPKKGLELPAALGQYLQSSGKAMLVIPPGRFEVNAPGVVIELPREAGLMLAEAWKSVKGGKAVRLEPTTQPGRKNGDGAGKGPELPVEDGKVMP